MSVYSTLTIRRKDIIKLIAKELNIDLQYNEMDKTEWNLLESILFEITSRNPHSPFQYNNYWVVSDEYEPMDEYDKVYSVEV